MVARMTGSLLALSLVATGLPGCGSTAPRQLVDLTYSFGEETIYWPKNKAFTWEKTAWGQTSAGYWYSSAVFATSEHGGTHMDAPLHFGESRRAVDQIPVEELMASAVVIDLRPQCQANPDYELTVEDLRAWEAAHGRIADQAVVFMLTGWGRHWPNRTAYLGSATPDDASTLHFPGFSAKAAEFLVKERAIRGVGIDTASIDPGRSSDFPVHRIVNGANAYGLENVASLDRLPPKGATVLALPMKIKGGTGAPVRIVALLP
ncbi:MAG: cyclase [Proteobacteria bacterium HN_bin10]|nr:MAG: cyclase [Proteobacteria bacterium HN_bin10]